MAFARVQATARVSGSGTSIAIPFSTPPTVGNAILVPVAAQQNGIVLGTCTDNYGNTYALAKSQIQTTGTDVAAAIYVCEQLTASGASFTITVTFSPSGNYTASAIEVSGGTGLVLDKTAGAVGSSTTPATGATAALTAAEEFVVALHAIGTNMASITIAVVSPTWTQEFEQLSSSGACAGEADSRILTSASGTTTSASWTDGTTGNWAAALAAFKAGASAQSVSGATIASTAATFAGSVALAPSGGLYRVQATGKVLADGAASVALTFTSPPTVGNGIVVLGSLYRGSGSGTPPTCADNRGNTYSLAKHQTGFSGSEAAILYCPAVATSAAPFTITVTFTANSYFTASALEVSGVGTGLTLDRTTGANSVGSVTPATGATAALTAAEELLVAVFATPNSQASITVEVVSPSWTEEHEERSSAHSPGEGDSRIVTGVLGATASCSWTLASSATWAAALAAFKASGGADQSVAGATIASTTVVRAGGVPRIVLGTTRASTTQLFASTVAAAQPLRATQLVAELLDVVPASPLAATQLLAETLLALPPQPDQARVTQLVCELIVIAYEQPVGCPTDNFPIDLD